MIKLIRLIYSSYCWSRAISLSSDEKYDKTLCFLEKSESNRLVVDGEFLVLKGFLYGALGRIDDSRVILNHAIKRIAYDKDLNSDERKYLILYSNILIDNSNSLQGKVNDDIVNLSRVADHYKKKFPVK